MLKKSLFVLLFVGLIISILAGLTVAETKITFWHAMTEHNKEALQHISEKFEEENPGVNVDLIYQGGYGELAQKVTTSAAAGELPVASQQYEDSTIQYVNADLMKEMGSVVGEEFADNLPAALVDSNTYNGKLFTLPINKSAMVLYYNTDLIEDPPETWEELLAIAKELTLDQDGDGEMEQYGFGLRPYAEMFSLFFHQAGGEFLNQEKNELLIDSEQGVQALDFLVKLNEYSLYQSEYLSGPFGSGKVAMYIGSSAGLPFVDSATGDKHGWDTGPLPDGPDNGESMIQGTNVGVFKVGNSEEQVDAGLKFVQYLIKDKWTIYWAKKTGYTPVTLSALDSDEWTDYLKENPKRQAISQMMKEGFVYPHHPNFYNVRQEIETVLEKALLGKGDPEELLEAGAKKIEEKYLQE